MKIQINNLEAIEKLIGNDTELEIEVRQNIIEKFTKKHLTGLVSNEIINKAKESCISELKGYLIEPVMSSFNSNDIKLTDKAKSILDNYITNTFNRFLISHVNKSIKFDEALIKIEKAVDDAVLKIEYELKDSILEHKINKMVDDKLRKLLNL